MAGRPDVGWNRCTGNHSGLHNYPLRNTIIEKGIHITVFKPSRFADQFGVHPFIRTRITEPFSLIFSLFSIKFKNKTK